MPLVNTGLPLVRTSSARMATREVGGWLAQGRARKGRPVGKVMMIAGKQVQINGAQTRWLTFSEMWTIYRRVPDVRAAIDSIVRRVATWDWIVEPTADPADPVYESLLEEAEGQRRFLQAPNTDSETWQELITKFVTDLLAFDQAAIEVVKNGKQRLAELVALRGSTINPLRDELGRLSEYVQDYSMEDGWGGSANLVHFQPDELMFFRLFPSTAGMQGNSLMETLIDEVVTVLRASEHAMLAFDADEIPPGIVVLYGLSGQSAKAAADDLREMKGQDHKIRVLTTPDPSGKGAAWVELRHTPKDLSMREIVNDIRRVIWRVFGVMPVEMGATEDVNRATAEVQLVVGSSHLVNPILEMIEAKINARILPMLASKPALVGKTRFRFDRETKLTPEQQKAAAERLDMLVRGGIMTRNEARGELKLRPIEGGDILTVETGLEKLELVLKSTGEVSDPSKPGGGDPENPDDDTDPNGDGKAGTPNGEDDAPGESGNDKQEKAAPTPNHRLSGETQQACIARKLPEIQAASPKMTLEAAIAAAYDVCDAAPPGGITVEAGDRKGRARPHEHDEHCGCAGAWGDTLSLVSTGLITARVGLGIESERSFRRARDLPSDWQPAGRFRDYRTLDLNRLGDALSQYAREVRPIWREARDEVVAAVASAYDPDRGGFTEDTAQAARDALDAAVERLEMRWRASTAPRYREAAKIARDAAVDWTGDAEAASDYEAQAETYFARAMQFLTADGGPIQDAKRAVQEAIRAAVQAQRALLDPPEHRAELDPTAFKSIIDEATLLATTEAAFNGQEFRLYHWSGKLNELSNDVLTRTLDALSVAEGRTVTTWYAEWVYVGDKATCQTCEQEGMQGIRPLSAFKTRPGGDTECRGNCRCVLVVWTREEVESGRAERLGPIDGGGEGE